MPLIFLNSGDDDISPEGEGYKRYNESLEETKIHIMLDSIVVATPSWHPESLAVLVDICNNIQELLFNLDAPILLRGAIAVGDFYLNAYNDDRVRQKYLWLEKELERIKNKGYVPLVVQG